MTALSVARERELGTFDQLMVAPLRKHEILIAKMLPPLIIGVAHMTLDVLAAVFLFGVPLRGSLLLLYGSGVFFLAAVVGIGLFISALSATQEQAILGAFLFMAPAVLLSGFATRSRTCLRGCSRSRKGQPTPLRLGGHPASSSRGWAPPTSSGTRSLCF